MTSTAYSRSSKLPGGGGERRLPPRLMRSLTSKIEPKKLGVGLVAGCCLALLTYVSLAKLFAIYSPVFASTANTSALMQNAPPTSSKPSVPETETIPPQETLGGGGGRDSADPVDPREEAAGSDEPGLPEAAVTRKDVAGSDEPGLPTRKDDGDNAAAEPTNKPSAAAAEDKEGNGGQGGGGGGGKMTCDENGVDEGFPYARPTVCELSGDVRVSPKQKMVYLVNPSGAGGFDESGEKRLRPYARKDDFLMPGVTEVTVKSVPSAAVAPKCTKHHTVPAVVFSIAGYTDNFFHDMTDALVPLFLTTSHLEGEVQLLVTNYKPWWVQKYTPLLRKMSRHDVINFDAEDADDVHCFPAGAFVGLYRDRDLILSPHATRNPRNLTMVDFGRFLRGALALPRDRPAVLGEAPGMRPRMLIISRAGTRRLLNLEEVAAAADELGFNVTCAEAGADVPAFAAQVNAADVLVGVHGAGLANMVFLPTEAVVVQIVPWGKMDWMATNFYGRPAPGMGLRYLEYYVGEEETSLKDKYPREHVVFRDPMALHKQGWQALAQTVMKQDVAVNLTRFRPVLLQALDKLQQ